MRLILALLTSSWRTIIFSLFRMSGARFLGPFETWKLLKPTHKGLVIDGCSQRLSAQDSFQHLALIARTGAGKTTRYIIPNLLKLDDCSMVVTDPSGEIHKLTARYLKQKGFLIKVINPADPQNSLRYNPLAKVDSYTDISEVAHILVRSANADYEKNQFWYSDAETIIDVLIQCLKNQNKPEALNLQSLLRHLQNFGEDGKNLDKFVLQHGSDSTYHQYKGFISGNPKIMQSFLSVALNSLKMINNPDIAQVLSADDLDFSDLRKRKTLVYLIVPSEKIAFYSFFLNLFYTQFFNACMKALPTKADLPIYVLCDEFGHTSIPNFSTIVTTIRKYQVSISIVLQSISQLEARYGQNEARTILEGGITSKLFYSGVDMRTAQMLEQHLCKVRHPYRLPTGQTAHREKNLMNADQIRTMKDNQALFLFSNKEPVVLHTKPFYRKRELKVATQNRERSKPFENTPRTEPIECLR